MLKVVARHFIKPEKFDEFLALSRRLIEETLQNDPGVISYAMYQDTEKAYTVAMFEEWEDQAAADAHLQSPHFLELAGPLVACWDGPSEIHYYKPL